MTEPITFCDRCGKTHGVWSCQALRPNDLTPDTKLKLRLSERELLIERLTTEVSAAWVRLEMFGVTKERGKDLPGALDVLDSRLSKESRINDCVAADNEKLSAEVQRLEDAMRSIQAVTSDVAVVDITDEALCPDSDSGKQERDIATRRIGDHVDLHRRATADSRQKP